MYVYRTIFYRTKNMNLHIELDSNHPSYEWLVKQADKIGAKGHFGTHIDCYTSTPEQNQFTLPAHIIDCRHGMPTPEEASALPSLKNKALILHTGNMYKNDYGTDAYFGTPTFIQEDALKQILDKSPQLILIDSYGIGKHGPHHTELDKTCEASGCYVVENIRIIPEEADKIHTIQINFDLNYPSTGKPCTITY